MNHVMLAAIYLILTGSLSSQICHKKFDPENCKVTLLTEFGISKAIYKKFDKRTFDYTISAQLGYSRKVSNHFGIAGLVHIDLNRDLQIGLAGRMSYYLNNKTELSLTPIMFFKGALTTHKIEAAIDYKNHFGIFSNIEFLNPENEPKNHIINLGIKTRGVKATTSYIISAGLIGLVAIAIHGSR